MIEVTYNENFKPQDYAKISLQYCFEYHPEKIFVDDFEKINSRKWKRISYNVVLPTNSYDKAKTIRYHETEITTYMLKITLKNATWYACCKETMCKITIEKKSK